jgi:thiamine-monophosphate kinase
VGPPKPTPAGSETQQAGEDAAIQRIGRRVAEVFGAPTGSQRWVGDDAAVLETPEADLVMTVDSTVEGVHVSLDLMSLEDVGWRAMSRAMSDVAAMGSAPRFALVSVCLPPTCAVDELYEGLLDAAASYACPIVGGDLVAAPLLSLSIAIGAVTPDGEPVGRDGARPGDAIFVTGPLGAGAAGLRLLRADPVSPGGDPLVDAYRRPRAQLAAGWAARASGAAAMMDISDGLAIDLDRLVRASGVGFRLDDLPVAPGATLAEALGGGDDYQLLIVSGHPGAVVEGFASSGLPAPTPIGRCTADPEERQFRGAPVDRLGWEHGIR